jgi:hypothetical protein
MVNGTITFQATGIGVTTLGLGVKLKGQGSFSWDVRISVSFTHPIVAYSQARAFDCVRQSRSCIQYII